MSFSGSQKFVYNGLQCYVDDLNGHVPVLLMSQIPSTAPTVCNNHSGSDIFTCDNCGDGYLGIQIKKVFMNWALVIIARALFPKSFPQHRRIDSINIIDLNDQKIIDEFISLLRTLDYNGGTKDVYYSGIFGRCAQNDRYCQSLNVKHY